MQRIKSNHHTSIDNLAKNLINAKCNQLNNNSTQSTSSISSASSTSSTSSSSSKRKSSHANKL